MSWLRCFPATAAILALAGCNLLPGSAAHPATGHPPSSGRSTTAAPAPSSPRPAQWRTFPLPSSIFRSAQGVMCTLNGSLGLAAGPGGEVVLCGRTSFYTVNPTTGAVSHRQLLGLRQVAGGLEGNTWLYATGQGLWDVYQGTGSWSVAYWARGRWHLVPVLDNIGFSAGTGGSLYHGPSLAALGKESLWLTDLQAGPAGIRQLVQVQGDGRVAPYPVSFPPGWEKVVSGSDYFVPSGSYYFLLGPREMLAYQMTPYGLSREGQLAGNFDLGIQGLEAAGDGRGGVWFATPGSQGGPSGWRLGYWRPGSVARFWPGPVTAAGRITVRPRSGGAWVLESCLQDECQPPHPPAPHLFAFNASQGSWRQVSMAGVEKLGWSPGGAAWASLPGGGAALLLPDGARQPHQAGWPDGYLPQGAPLVDAAGNGWLLAEAKASGTDRWILAELPAAAGSR